MICQILRVNMLIKNREQIDTVKVQYKHCRNNANLVELVLAVFRYRAYSIHKTKDKGR